MGSYLTIQCPGCKQSRPVANGGDYQVCKKCATPHCIYCGGGPCKVPGCANVGGWLEKRKNPT